MAKGLLSRIGRSAAYRIAIVNALGFATATVLLGVVVVIAAHAAFMRQLEAQIVEDSGALFAEYRLEGHEGLNFAIAEREGGNTTNELLYAVYDRGGHRIAGGLQAQRPATGWSDMPFSDPREGPDLARAWATELPDGTRLVVAADKSVVDRVDRTLASIFAAAFVAISILSLVGALLLGSYLRKRLAAISDAADAIMAGDVAERVPEGIRGDEFDRLARSLNKMLDRITGLLDNLRQVSSDIAHDLRTPLTRLRNHLEESLSEWEASGQNQERLRSAVAQTDQLLALFTAILRISEVEGGKRRASFQRFDLSALLSELAESYAPALEEAGRIFESQISASIHINGDRELIAQAVINLLDNSNIHTPPGTRIVLTLIQCGREVILSVADNGLGVPDDARDKIVLRFVQLDKGRSTQGYGLGLNLVAAIASMHGGSLNIRDNRPGLDIRLILATPMLNTR